MEPDDTTPLLATDEFPSQKLYSNDAASSDCDSNSSDNARNRRARLPFHYPQVHKTRVRREAGSDGLATYQRYRYYNRLADPSIDTLSIPDHVVPPNFFFPFESIIKSTGKQSSFITIFSIWNTMMGSSLLSIPWAIQQAGFACGLVIMFVMGGVCFYTAYRIVSLRNIADVPTSAVEFPDFCRHLLGPWAEKIATFFSLIPLLGGAVVYWVLQSNFIYFIGVYAYESLHGHKLTPDLQNSTYPDVYCPSSVPLNETVQMLYASNSTVDPFYKYWDMNRTIPFYIAIVFGILISSKSASFFAKLNALGTFCVLYLIIFICIKGYSWGIHFNTFDPLAIDFVPLFKVATAPVLVGTLSLSFFIHNCVLSIMRNQKNPENNARDLAIAYVLVGATYLVIGVVFIITFPFEKDCIQDNLLNNFRSSDPLAMVTRIVLAVQILTLYPLIVYILRVQVMHFFYGTIYPG